MIKRSAVLSVLRIAGFAVGAVAVSGAAVLVTASAAGYLPFVTPSSPASTTSTATLAQQAPKPSAVCSDFITHFSADLNASQSAINAAFQKAIAQTVADEVKNGKLTQARANAIKQRLAGKAPCAIAGALSGPAAGAVLGVYRQALLSAAASALGITDPSLKTDLHQGMTLSQIAAAEKPAVTEALFRSRLISNLTPLLDKAVASKKLSAAREKTIIARLQTGTIPFWNKPMAGKAPAATTTPTSNT